MILTLSMILFDERGNLDCRLSGWTSAPAVFEHLEGSIWSILEGGGVKKTVQMAAEMKIK